MAKKITLKEIGEMQAHVVKHKATKNDIARLREQVNSIEAKLRYGRYEKRLGDLEEKVIGGPRR